MSKLHDTLEKYYSVRNSDPEFKEPALAYMEEEIVKEIIEQEVAKIESRARELERKRMEKERHEKMAQRIKDAERTFWIVVVLGLMIGLAGNQITEIISSAKEQFEVNPMIPTMLVTVAIAYGIYLIFQRHYISTAVDLINEFARKGQKEQ
ncbi:MAG: hypothetical protein ACFNLF_04290 [Selenomonas noxia]|jgi:hypothetical protein|uniref:hypothetical protein n=1 Tax=Selenomonas noxia TaxID=135083 RepID=UPI001CB2230C|nr:hypothetical protein [Selenomonas noxia]MBF1662766.1 hypothetical protein [Selenomonas noxia]